MPATASRPVAPVSSVKVEPNDSNSEAQSNCSREDTVPFVGSASTSLQVWHGHEVSDVCDILMRPDADDRRLSLKDMLAPNSTEPVLADLSSDDEVETFNNTTSQIDTSDSDCESDAEFGLEMSGLTPKACAVSMNDECGARKVPLAKGLIRNSVKEDRAKQEEKARRAKRAKQNGPDGMGPAFPENKAQTAEEMVMSFFTETESLATAPLTIRHPFDGKSLTKKARKVTRNASLRIPIENAIPAIFSDFCC